jgi:cytochrome c
MHTLETTRRPWIQGQLAGAALIGALLALSIRTVSGQAEGPANDDPRARELVELVTDAAKRIERDGESAFDELRAIEGRSRGVFVLDEHGVERVNPPRPGLEGRSLLDEHDANGKPIIRALLDVARTRGSGWVDSAWLEPGELVATRSSTYVARAALEGRWFLVGSGLRLTPAE